LAVVRVTCPWVPCPGSLFPDTSLPPGRFPFVCPKGHAAWIIRDKKGRFQAAPADSKESGKQAPLSRATRDPSFDRG
jgi:hypothetical protein